MKSRALIFLLIIVIPISVFSQIDFRVDYHPHINKAELAITSILKVKELKSVSSRKEKEPIVN